MKKIYLTITLAIGIMASAQVKIGDNATSVNANSLLELESTTKGVLFPRVALTGTANVAPLAAHVQGMTIYNTATAGDVTPGMYTNSGSAWVKLGASSAPEYHTIKGNVTTVTTTTYTLAANDYAVITNNSTGVTITMPNLTLADAGRTIFIFNNNTAAVANSFAETIPTGVATQNQFRAMEIMWTGTFWAIMGK
jgi:hypothetical protein